MEHPPEYHTISDTLGPHQYEHCRVNNLPMCTEVIKAAVACLATLAQVDGRTGVDEVFQSLTELPLSGVTIIHNTLQLDIASASELKSELLAATGRKVMDLHPGANDIRHIAPGVYFISQERGKRITKAVLVR